MPLYTAEQSRMAERRRRLVDTMRRILDAAEAAGASELTRSQAADYAAAEAEYNELTARLAEEGVLRDAVAVRMPAEGGIEEKRAAQRRLEEGERQLGLEDYARLRGDAPADGFGVRALKPEERMASLADGYGTEPLSFGRFIRGLVTGDWRGAEAERRALSEGTPDAGGYLVPTQLSNRVIDLARAKTAAIQAGALTIPMSSNVLDVAKATSDPAAGWKSENAAATASDMTFDRIRFQARTLMALVKVSVELMEDSQLLAGTLENALAQALALELDRVALYGSGTAPEPKGLKNWPGVQVYSMGTNGAALTSYAPFSQAVQLIQQANGTPNAVIMAPRTAGEVDRLADTTGQPLQPPESYRALKKLVTSQVPVNLAQGTANNATDVFAGDFSQLLIGMRQQIRVEVSREASDASSSAFSNLQVWVRAYLRADIAVAQPAHFCIVTGIVPAA